MLAGGVDALSRVPLLLSDAMVLWLSSWYAAKTFGQKASLAAKFRPAYLAPVVGIMKGLTDPMVGLLMGQTAENVAHKFGITRSWDTLSMEIRAGRLDRAQAIARLRDTGAETPWPDIEAFCGYLGLSRREYFDVLEGFRNRELWSRRGRPYSIHQQQWPQWDEETAREDVISLIIQINGKTRDKIDVPADLDEESLRRIALESEKVRHALDGNSPRKVIVARGSLVNIVA